MTSVSFCLMITHSGTTSENMYINTAPTTIIISVFAALNHTQKKKVNFLIIMQKGYS